MKDYNTGESNHNNMNENIAQALEQMEQSLEQSLEKAREQMKIETKIFNTKMNEMIEQMPKNKEDLYMYKSHTLAFSIRRPWPKREPAFERSEQPRWKLRGTFWTIAGRQWYWPSLIEIYHVEPHDFDTRTPCMSRRWRLHFWHWRFQIIPVQSMKQFLFERCIECGKGYSWGYATFSHEWHEQKSRWFRVTRRAYHYECSLLVTLRHQSRLDEEIIRHLHNGTHESMEWPLLNRLNKIVEGERNYDR
nr:hypothetical protein [uncultured bacterium]AMP54320.1 hypothetical protein [uncultured bacterium]AMP54354.1 hypothetical protein [uncultured bacterium]AMP54432.1 hypothetical protein [uncultured bacterium]